MNGAPAKPISGVAPSSRTSRPTASATGATCSSVQGRQPLDVRGRAHRRGDHRPRARHDVDADARGVQRHDDVAEEDRGVHPVPAHRLHRDLAGELGRQAGVEHAGVGAERAVLGQRPARLAHEPHRHACGTPAAGGDEERGVAQVPARPREGRHGGGGRGDHDPAILPRRRRVPRARPPGHDGPARCCTGHDRGLPIGLRRACAGDPELRSRVPARVRPDRPSGGVPARRRRAVGRAAAPGARGGPARRAAAAGPLHLGRQRGGRRRPPSRARTSTSRTRRDG